MGTSNLLPVPTIGDWRSVQRAFEILNHRLGYDAEPTFGNLTVSGLSASQLLGTNASKIIVSVEDLTQWIAGTSNQITVTDDGDGTLTLSAPQDLHTEATPTFNQVTLNNAPTSNTDAATKSYADSLVAGAFWENVAVATIENIDLSTDLEAGDTIDDYTLIEGDRVLVKEQTDQTQNGLYVVQASGAAVRATDADDGSEIENKKCIVLNGSLTAHRFYFCISSDITIGVTNIQFAEVTLMTAHYELSGIQGGTSGPPAEYYHLTLAQHTELAAIAALGTDAGKFLYTTGASTWAEGTITDAGRALLDDADASAQRTTLGLVIGTDVLAQQTIGIANDNLVEIDSAGVAVNDYAKFTAAGLEGRSYSEVKTDLSLDSVENTALSTWAGTSNITTVGTLVSGAIGAGFTEIGTDYTTAKCTDATADNTAANETSHADVLVDGDFASAGLMATDGIGGYSIVTNNSANWDTAYGWGDHSGEGYLTGITGESIGDLSDVDLTDIANNKILKYNSTSEKWECEDDAGGSITGPGSSTDNAVTRWNGVGGDTIQNSLVTIDDAGTINIPSGETYNINSVALPGTDGWAEAGETWTKASTTTFTITGDKTTKYSKGVKVKFTDGGSTTHYATITSATYGSPNTTITIASEDDIADGAITNPYYSYMDSPFGYKRPGDWYSCYAYLSGNQSIPTGSATLTQFDSTVFDPSSAFDTGNYKWVCPISGYYQIKIQADYAANATGVRYFQFYVGAVLTIQASLPSLSASIETKPTEIFVLYVTRGQEITCQAYQSSGGNLNLIGTSPGTQMIFQHIGF